MEAVIAERSDAGSHTMRCLEVWGGNQAVDNGVVMAGLDAWLYSRPYGDQSAGGDIHYVSSCAAGMVTRVLVADVSGHGEAVSETAAGLRELMRRYVNYVDQTRFVEGLNEEFGALAQAGGFATAVVATYLALTDELQLCNAGHPRPLWYQAKSRQWSMMAEPQGARQRSGPSNTPLGVVQACYDRVDVRLAQGDLLVLYTDSLIEAPGPDGKALGQEGLLQLAKRLDASDPGEFLHALLREIEGGEGAWNDDVTVLILRPNGLRPRLSLAVRLASTMRMTGAFLRSLRPGGDVFAAPEDGPLAWAGSIVNRKRRGPHRG